MGMCFRATKVRLFFRRRDLRCMSLAIGTARRESHKSVCRCFFVTWRVEVSETCHSLEPQRTTTYSRNNKHVLLRWQIPVTIFEAQRRQHLFQRTTRLNLFWKPSRSMVECFRRTPSPSTRFKLISGETRMGTPERVTDPGTLNSRQWPHVHFSKPFWRGNLPSYVTVRLLALA